MPIDKAAAFVWKLIGFELCTGAGEDQSAIYYISPVARAFLEGAIGPTACNANYRELLHRVGTRDLAEFLIAAGKALLPDGKAGE